MSGNLNDVRGPRMTAKKTLARVWSDRLEWSVTSFGKAGVWKVEIVKGHEEVAAMIERDDRVLLGQMGVDYLIGFLR